MPRSVSSSTRVYLAQEAARIPVDPRPARSMAGVCRLRTPVCDDHTRNAEPEQRSLVLFRSNLLLLSQCLRHAVFTRCQLHQKSEGRKFWTIALWVPSLWLLLSGIIFLYLDWFGHSVHWTPIEHIRNAFAIAAPMLVSGALLASIALSIRKLPVAAAVHEQEGWRKALAVGSKILAWLSLVMGSLLTVLAGALVLLMASCTPPSLRLWQDGFQQNARIWSF